MSKMAVLRMIQMETENVQIGDKILVPLTGFGEFFATAHKITNEGVLFVFDDYVTVRPMNKTNTNKGGFENSDLKKWMDTVLLEAFPDQLRDRISKLTIPTVGELFGHEDAWYNEYLEPDMDEQLPLMKKRRNRVAYFDNQPEWGWLQNATKHNVSATSFAFVNASGLASDLSASNSLGVRPAFTIV